MLCCCVVVVHGGGGVLERCLFFLDLSFTGEFRFCSSSLRRSIGAKKPKRRRLIQVMNSSQTAQSVDTAKTASSALWVDGLKGTQGSGIGKEQT